MSGLGIVLAAILTVLAHVGSNPDLNAVSLTISDYAVSNRGGPMDWAMFILGVTSLAVPLGLRAVRAPVGPVVVGLLLVWSGGLMAAAIVPTDPAGVELSTTGYAHRYVSVAAFVCLPVAVLVAVRGLAADPRWHAALGRLRGLALTSAGGLVALYLVAYPGDRIMMGLVQRLLVAVEVVLLAVLTRQLYRVAGVPCDAPGAP